MLKSKASIKKRQPTTNESTNSKPKHATTQTRPITTKRRATKPTITISTPSHTTPSSLPHQSQNRTFFSDPLAPAGAVPRNRQNRNISPNQPDFDYINQASELNKELYGRTPSIKKKQQQQQQQEENKPHPSQAEIGMSAIDLYAQQPVDINPSKPSPETANIVNSIEEYNAWIGKKMSQPVLQSLQSLFITHGLTQAPQTISTVTPKQHILQTLLRHGIIVPHEFNFETIPKELMIQKQPHVLEFLKTMRQFGLFTSDILQKYKPGFVNPNIKFSTGRFQTNQFDISLEEKDSQIGNKKQVKKRVNTVIDTIIDCLRLAGAFDVQTINPQTLKQKLSGLLVPPTGEGAVDTFDHVTLEKYDQTALKDHECTQHSLAWYQSTLKNEVSIPVLQQLHAKFYRYDISFGFRTQFEDLYNKMMSFDQEAMIAENPNIPVEELLNKFAPTKTELQLFRTLIYDEHIQTRFYQHYIKSPNQKQYISVNNSSYAAIYHEQKAKETKQRQYIGKMFTKLQQIASPDDYPEVYATDLVATNKLGDGAEAADQAQTDNTQTTKKKSKTKFMILPPEENFIFTAAKKAFYLLIADQIIPRPPEDFDGTMQEWICTSLVTNGTLKVIPEEDDDAKPTLPQIPHPDYEGEFIEVDTEEHELLDLLYDMELIPQYLMGRLLPAKQTPLLLKTDDQSTDYIKRLLLDAVLPVRPMQIRVPKKQNQRMVGEDNLDGNDENTQNDNDENQNEDNEDQFETVTVMRRPIPIARRVVDTIIDAQQLDLETQEPIEGLIGNTTEQIDTTWPKFIQMDSDHESDDNNTQGEFIYQHDLIQMEPFKRTPENDKATTDEIQSFDYLLANLDHTQNFPQIQSFLVQFYRHDICLTFARDHPGTFAKLIKPVQPEYDPANQTLEVDFTPPTFSDSELSNVRWLLSNLHVQYHLTRKYKENREDFEFESAKARKTGREVPKVQYQHILIGGGFNDQDAKKIYTDLWKGYVVGARLNLDKASDKVKM